MTLNGFGGFGNLTCPPNCAADSRVQAGATAAVSDVSPPAGPCLERHISGSISNMRSSQEARLSSSATTCAVRLLSCNSVGFSDERNFHVLTTYPGSETTMPTSATLDNGNSVGDLP